MIGKILVQSNLGFIFSRKRKGVAMAIRSYCSVFMVIACVVQASCNEWDSGSFFAALNKFDLAGVKKASEHPLFNVNALDPKGLNALDYIVTAGRNTPDVFCKSEELKKLKSDEKFNREIMKKVTEANAKEVVAASAVLDFLLSKNIITTKVDPTGNSHLIYLIFRYGENYGANKDLIKKIVAHALAKEESKTSIVNKANNDGYTPLLFVADLANKVAKIVGDKEKVEKLLPLEKNELEKRLILYRKLIVYFIYEAHADIHAKTKKNWTLLHFILSIPDAMGLAKQLVVFKKASLFERTDKGKLPLAFMGGGQLDTFISALIGSTPSVASRNEQENLIACYKAFLLGKPAPQGVSKQFCNKALNAFKIQFPQFKKID